LVNKSNIFTNLADLFCDVCRRSNTLISVKFSTEHNTYILMNIKKQRQYVYRCVSVFCGSWNTYSLEITLRLYAFSVILGQPIFSARVYVFNLKVARAFLGILYSHIEKLREIIFIVHYYNSSFAICFSQNLQYLPT